MQQLFIKTKFVKRHVNQTPIINTHIMKLLTFLYAKTISRHYIFRKMTDKKLSHFESINKMF